MIGSIRAPDRRRRSGVRGALARPDDLGARDPGLDGGAAAHRGPRPPREPARARDPRGARDGPVPRPRAAGRGLRRPDRPAPDDDRHRHRPGRRAPAHGGHDRDRDGVDRGPVRRGPGRRLAERLLLGRLHELRRDAPVRGPPDRRQPAPRAVRLGRPGRSDRRSAARSWRCSAARPPPGSMGSRTSSRRSRSSPPRSPRRAPQPVEPDGPDRARRRDPARASGGSPATGSCATWPAPPR